MVFRLGNIVAACVVMLALAPSASAWAWPVDGPVLRPFVAENDPYTGGQHRGIDIGAPTGAEVRSAATGVVGFAGRMPHEGLCLTVRTEDGYSVTLVHLGSIALRVGTAVSEGDVVGTIGASGDAEGPEPYVHLGIRLTADPNGYLDPESLLPVRRADPAPQVVHQAPAPPAPPAAAPARATPKTVKVTPGRQAPKPPRSASVPARRQPVRVPLRNATPAL